MSNSDNSVSFLKNVPFFKSLSDRQLKSLAKVFTLRNFSEGEAMVKQGERGLGIFIVVTGQAEAMRENANGETVSVNTFGPTDYFGELTLLSEGTRTASVIARSDLDCLVLSQWEFISLLKGDADMAVSVAQELARRFRYTLDTIL
ncbi:MAG: hypothetical protein DHS20C20_00410 [Ardenticatenaceae bacterium]|nr:MAG: hypothetical protein DHS20C20_00410 [Ardenticatenaceae bacterium]